jgi:zinc transport system substrate-binding protein
MGERTGESMGPRLRRGDAEKRASLDFARHSRESGGPSRRLPTSRSCVLALLILAALLTAPAAAAPEVMVSIKPIHSLISGVMAGIGAPDLIVGGANSPHDYSLKPSDAARLERAELVVWIGPIFENYLERPLALADKAEILELDRTPGLILLPTREGGAWEPEEDAQAHGHGALAQDGHLWLDPRNAKAIVRLAAERLAAHDAANAARYRSNAAGLEQRLDALDAALARRLAPVKGVPFVVFHDAYQYLERRYGLTAIGSITVSPERPPGARRLETIRAKIRAVNARCVFSEPQFQPRLIATLIAGTRARSAVLDPEGTVLPRGPGLYFTLMNGLADSLIGCLAPE